MARKPNAAPADETLETKVEETPKGKAEKPKIHPSLSFFDKWRVDLNFTAKTDSTPRKVKFTAIKKLREGVKLTESEVARLNFQSHNSGLRYYPAGSITNGNEETITINE